MLNVTKRRQEDKEKVELEVKTLEGEVARSKTSSVDKLLEHLKQKHPNTLPIVESTPWQLGVLKGRQDVIREIEYLLTSSHN